MRNSKSWTRFFKRRSAFHDLKPEDRSEIVEAFVYKGSSYYTFKDIFRLPTARGLQALDYYEEFNMRCTRDYLTKLCSAFEEILSNPKKLELVKLGTLVKHLRERLEMIPVEKHIFKLASVMFFDETENPFFYDRNYAEKKIDLWQQDPEVLSFFLRKPLADLLPYSDLEKANFHSYSVIVEMLNNLHQREVLRHLSPEITTIDM